MNIHAFRKHLAEELEGIPADAERSFESYAVTTAALARQLLEYLAIDDLSVPDGFRDEPPNYPLRMVLDRILHFRVLYQDAITFNVPGMADLFTLYSDQTQEYRDHLYIRLGDYRDVVGRLASDDRYVARHLLRRSVTLMNSVMRGSSDGMAPRELLKQGAFRNWVLRMLYNAWDLLVTLTEAGEVSCPELSVECYEHRFGDGDDEYLQDFSAVSTGRDLIGGYGRFWWWGVPPYAKLDIGGRERHCMFLSAIRSEDARTKCYLVVTFDSFIEIFQDARRQLDGA